MWILLLQGQQHMVWSTLNSRILSAFNQSSLLVTYGNISNIKSVFQNNFLKIQRFSNRSLAHPFWPEDNPEVLIKGIILSKYRKQQAMKHEIISFLVSYTDLQTWDGAHVHGVIACHGAQLDSVLTPRSYLACSDTLAWSTGMLPWHRAGIACGRTASGWGCTEERVTASC